MTEPRDRIDSWLDADVEPLAPPPGAFGRISKRARRRKTSRALVSAAGVVVLIGAAVALPRAAATLLHGGGGAPRPAAAGSAPSRPAASPVKTHPVRGGGTPAAHSATPELPGTSSLSPGGSGSPAPGKFQPTSVTFVNSQIGAVIGQAGHPGHCYYRYCTSLAGTSDYGATWYGVSAPVTGPPQGSTGVSQLRFLNLQDGWAFGPGLFVTHDGGAHWSQENTSGRRVTSLETAGSRAFAIFARCTGSTAAYAATCGSFSLYSSPADGDTWSPVPGPAGALTLSGAGAGYPASASLLLVGGPAGGTGYLLGPAGQIYSGPLAGGAWRLAGQAPMAPGAAGPAGQPTSGLLAAGSGRLYELTTTTTTAGRSQPKGFYFSADGGKSWHQAGAPPAAGIARSLAAVQGNIVVLATTAGLDVSRDGGATWTRAEAGPPGAAAGEQGFSYVGMTDQRHGVAVPADPQLHEVFITTDGGASWPPRLIQG